MLRGQFDKQGLDADHAGARCRELNRQWQAIEPPADLFYHGQITSGINALRPLAPRSAQKQGCRVTGGSGEVTRIHIRRGRMLRYQRVNVKHLLAAQKQRKP